MRINRDTLGDAMRKNQDAILHGCDVKKILNRSEFDRKIIHFMVTRKPKRTPWYYEQAA